MWKTKNNYPLNAFRICVDRIGDDVEGRAYSPLKKDAVEFVGMGNLLVQMDELFDRVGYPQAFQDKRSFGMDKEGMNLYKGIPQGQLDAENIIGQSGRQKTMDVMVVSRKNTSWQGELYDADGDFLQNFNGEIELLAGVMEFANIS